MDFSDWQRHVAQVVADCGEWIGLADGDGVPLCDFPAAESVSAPNTRLAIADREVVIPARGRIAPTSAPVEALIARDLGRFDEQGYLAPATEGDFMVIIARPGLRLAFWVVFARAAGPADAPDRLTVGGVSLTDALAFHPCPSIPLTWTPNFETFEEDAGGVYRSPRRLASVEMATRADGYTVTGPAVPVIRDLCQDSFDAVNAQHGWSADPHLVVDYGLASGIGERITIQVQDDYLWETIVAPAETAGVNVWVEMWWPGDPPFYTRGARQPSAGVDAPQRFAPPQLTEFPHAVGRVCVEEVGR